MSDLREARNLIPSLMYVRWQESEIQGVWTAGNGTFGTGLTAPQKPEVDES